MVTPAMHSFIHSFLALKKLHSIQTREDSEFELDLLAWFERARDYVVRGVFAVYFQHAEHLPAGTDTHVRTDSVQETHFETKKFE